MATSIDAAQAIIRELAVLPATLEQDIPLVSDCVVGYEPISVITVFARRGLQPVGIDEIPLAQGNELFRSNSRNSATHVS